MLICSFGKINIKNSAAAFSAEELPSFFLVFNLISVKSSSLFKNKLMVCWVVFYTVLICLSHHWPGSFLLHSALNLLVSQGWGALFPAELSSTWIGTYYKTLPKPCTSCHFLRPFPKVEETWEATFSAMVVLPNQDTKLSGFLAYECEIIAVICLSHMQLCSSIKKKWDFRSKNMGENWDQRCYDEWGLWHFREVQKLLVPRNTTRKRSGVFFWRIIRLQLSLQSWYMRRKKEMS